MEESDMTTEWHSNGNGGSTVADVLVDSLIAAGTATVAVFVAVPGLPTLTLAWAAFLTFAGTFLTTLAAARRRTRP
jgi:hypothetical protein